MWGPRERDDRAVSNVVGVVLLVGISIAAALLLLSAGQTTIDETRGQQSVELAADTFRQADSVFSSFPRSANNTGSRAIEVPERIQSGMETTNETTYRIRLNGDERCDSGARSLGSVRYESGEGTVIGYEGGGIWELTDGGAGMRSPPGISYERGNLNLRLRSIKGNVTDSERIVARSNRTRERLRDNRLSLLLYTNLTRGTIGSAPAFETICEPSSVRNATLYINDSDFAGAWARYARENYDPERVTVRPTGDVSAGENVSITFALGDVSRPEFSVSDVTTSRTASGDPLWVNATIRNEGGLRASQTVAFRFGNASTEVETASTSVTLRGGERRRVNFSVAPARLTAEVSPGTYEGTVSTSNDTGSEQVTFGTAPYVPAFEVDTTTAPSEAAVGDTATLQATVENTGGVTDQRTVTYRFDGTVRNETTVALDPGERATLTFALPTERSARHRWNVSTRTDFETADFVVGTAPKFTVRDLRPPESDTAGTTFSLNATINNTGQRSGARDVELKIQNTSTGNGVTDTQRVDVDGTLVDSTDVQRVNVSTTITTPGEYNYTVDTGDVTQTGGFTVGSQSRPNFVVTSLSFSADPTIQGNDVRFEAVVNNTGDARGTQDVTLSAGGVELHSEAVTLDPDHQTTITVTRTVAEPVFSLGDNAVTVATANATVVQELNVLENEPIYVGSGGKIVANERIDVAVTLLGAELEGVRSRYCDPDTEPCGRDFGSGTGYYRYENRNAPTEMSLFVQNATGRTERPLWRSLPGGGDVNRPTAERELLTGTNPYNESFTLAAGDAALVTGTSYRCDRWDATSIIWPDSYTAYGTVYDTLGLECAARGATRLSIDSTTDDPNVVVRNGSQTIRGGTNFSPQADGYQRNVREMLRSRLNASGDLDLAPGERVLIYELSDPGATIEQASDPGEPDYNDAVVLFQVLSRNRTISGPAAFEITDVQAPASVTQGDAATVTATVNNTGGSASSGQVAFAFDGSRIATSSTGRLDPNEETTVTFSVPTGSTGTFNYTASVVGSGNASRSGQITVGSIPTAYFQISEFSANRTALHRGRTASVDATIDNVGDQTGTQTIELRNVTAGNDTVVDSTVATIDDGDSERVSFELPTHTNGTLAYAVETADDASDSQHLYVNETHIDVNHTEVGLVSYGEGALVERRDLRRLTVGVENRGGLGGTRTVNLTVTNTSDGSVQSATQRVEAGRGRIAPPYPGYATFDMPALGVTSAGYYTYTVTIEDESGTVRDRWTGRIFVHSDASVGGSPNSNSPITVDAGQIQIGG